MKRLLLAFLALLISATVHAQSSSTYPSWNMVNGLNWSNPAALSAGTTWLIESSPLSGSINATSYAHNRVAPNWIVYNDTAVVSCASCNGILSSLLVNPKLQAGYDGYRFGIGIYLEADAAPVSFSQNLVGFSSLVNINSPMNGLPGSLNSADGTAFAANLNVFSNGAAQGTNYLAEWVLENDISVSGNVWRKFNTEVNMGGSDTTRGYLDDAAILFTNAGSTTWRCGLCFQGESSAGAFGTDSELIFAGRREIGSSTHNLTALYGVDWRLITLTAGGCFFAAINYCIDGNGYENTGLVNTATGIQQQSTGVASVTILSPPTAHGPVQGGEYNLGGTNGNNAFPTLNVQAPPTPGSGATATVTSMALYTVSIPLGFVPASGCSNGETVTAAQGGTSGNTNGTFVVTVSGGNITAVSSVVVGSIVSMAGATGISLTGNSTCTPATLTTNLGPYVLYNITGVSNTNGSGYPCNGPPEIWQGGGWTAKVNTPADFQAVMQSCTIGPVNFNPSSASAPLSVASWTTTGIWFGSGTTQQVNDATGTGTIPNEVFAAIPASTFTATSAITITNAASLFIGNTPTCSTNVTCTNNYGFLTNQASKFTAAVTMNAGATLSGGTIGINASGTNTNTIGNDAGPSTTNIAGTVNLENAGSLNVGILGGASSGTLNIIAGTGTGTINIGNATHTGLTKLNGLSTGTAADVLCLTAGGVVILQAAGSCTISQRSLKTNIELLADSDPILQIPVHTFSFKQTEEPNRDPNYTHPQAGLIAEEVDKALPICAIYENDMKTPKGYRPECIMAFLIKVAQDHQRVVKRQQYEIYFLMAWCLLLSGMVVRQRR